MQDYHVHSTCSGDGKASIEEMCAKAIEIGITEIAFTEHLVYNPADICYGTFDLGSYRSQIDAARRKFTDLRILTGLEFCDPHVYPNQLAEARSWRLDMILGSVHWLGDAMISVDSFAGLDVMETYHRYFDEVLKAVETGGFDILAHFDLVKRFGVRYLPFSVEPFTKQVTAILKVMIERGIALELNTSGLRQPCAEMFPGREILELYRKLGGELITIGSDAHRTEQLGYGLKEGISLLRSLGFTESDHLTIGH